MKRLFFWATVASGAAAAYMMHRRGESFGTIAKQAMLNPMGTLAKELKSRRADHAALPQPGGTVIRVHRSAV